jgi:hypothetical protein
MEGTISFIVEVFRLPIYPIFEGRALLLTFKHCPRKRIECKYKTHVAQEFDIQYT